MCEWCGHDHPVTALCGKRPRWSRRGFLAMLGVGVAGLALAPSLNAVAHQLGTAGPLVRCDAQGSVFRMLSPSTYVIPGDVVFDGRSICGVAAETIKAGEYGWVQTFGSTYLNIGGPQLLKSSVNVSA